MVAQSGGAFDAAWLKAAEEGARVDARQLARLSSLLNLQPEDISFKEDVRAPYRGLMAFEPEDAALFGGREVATKGILALLKEHPIVSVIGASGSGKSSVVKAGVVPALRNQPAPRWRGLIMRPGSDPLLALARALGREIDRDADEDARIVRARGRAQALRNGDAKLSDYFARIVELQTGDGMPPRLLLFVDQWEEVYTQTNDAALRRVFLDMLLEEFVKDRPYRLILTMRADFTGHLLEDSRRFADASKPGAFLLPRMTDDELAEAIRKPATAVGYTADDNLITMIIDEAGEEPGVLALVEFSLTELWKARDQNTRRLTIEAYVKLGGLKGSIDRHADNVFEQLNPEQQSVARRALTRLVQVSTMDSYTRQRRSLSDFDSAGLQVIQALARNRLVVVSHDEDRQDDVAEVAHEALIREWRKLREWVAADPGFLQWQEEVERKMRRHADNGLRDEDLLQGTDLEEALSYQRTRSTDLPSPVNTFITASQANKQKLEDEREADAKRLRQAEFDRETLARLNAEEGRKRADLQLVASRRFATWATIAALLLALLAVGVWTQYRSAVAAEKAAQVATDNAAHQAEIAAAQTKSALANETRALAALGQVALRDHLPVEALKLNLAAWGRTNDDKRPQLENVVRTISSILGSEQLPRKVFYHEKPVNGVLELSDGRLLSWSDDKTLRIWDPNSEMQSGPVLHHDDEVSGALIASNGRIVSWSRDKTLRRWDFRTGVPIGPAMRNDVAGAVLLQDDRILSWSWDHTAQIWNDQGLVKPNVIFRHEASVSNVIPMPNGRLLSWCNDIETLAGPFNINEPAPELNDKKIFIWDMNTGVLIRTIAHPQGVRGAFVMPHGNILSWSYDDTLRQWNSETGLELGSPMIHEGLINGALMIRGDQILSWSSDSTLRLWESKTGNQIGPTMHHEGAVNGVLIMPNGDILSWSDDKTLRLWDPKTGLQIGSDMHHGDRVTGALVMNDGRILSWSDDKTLRTWDPLTAEQIGVAMQHAGKVTGARPLGDKRIVSWSEDGSIRVWEPVAPHIVSRRDYFGLTDRILILPTGRLLVWSQAKNNLPFENTLRILDVPTATMVGNVMQHAGPVRGAALLPGGNIFSWSNDKTLRIWNPATGAEIGKPMRQDTLITEAIALPNGNILSWSSDYSDYYGVFDERTIPGEDVLHIWDTRISDITLTLQHNGVVLGALVMPDGNVLSWSKDHTLRRWNPESGLQIGQAMRHDGAVLKATVSYDGRIISWSDDDTLRIWDPKTGLQVGRSISIKGRYLIGATVMTDGNILCWSVDGRLSIWNPNTGLRVMPAMRHNDSVNGARLMPNGHILSWSDDKTLRLWDQKTGLQIGPSMLHDDRVTGALVMSHGRILSWCDDGTIRIWDAKTGLQIGLPMQQDGVQAAVLMGSDQILAWSADEVLQWSVGRAHGSLFEAACGTLPDRDLSKVSKLYNVTVAEPICEHPSAIPLPNWSTIEKMPESVNRRVVLTP